MPYRTVFIGMVCFFRQNGSRIALMPDGLHEEPLTRTIIAIDKPHNILAKSNNWGAAAHANGDFVVEESSTIHLEKADEVNPSTPLETKSFQPLSLKSGFKIDIDKAQTVAQVPISQGTLQSFLFPGFDPSPTTSVVTHLDVAHNGVIHVNVVSKSATKTIELRPGTEIAIVHETSKKGTDHFHLFQKLGSGADVGSTAPLNPNFAAYETSPSSHRAFSHPIVDGVNCPNTGCCP